MPRKRRRAKVRRLGFKDLPFVDLMHLRWAWIPPREGSLGKIRTLEDCREAWEQNREQFMVMCTCKDRNLRDCGAHSWGYEPGERPWGWWKFEAGRNRPYAQISQSDAEAQFPILKKMGVISEQEEKLFVQRLEAERRGQEEREAYLDSLGKESESQKNQGENLRPN